MDAIWIVPVFAIIDTLMVHLDHHSHRLAHVPDSEVLTVAVVAATYFQNHHERALAVMHATHYLSGTLSTSRFHRRLHALVDWLVFVSAALGEVLTIGEAFVIDSLPLPVYQARGCAAAARSADGSTVATVRLKTRSSSAGACT